MSGVLEGIRVVEYTQFLQGPMAGALLADLGADVLKIEQAGTGDPCRGMRQIWGQHFRDGRNVLHDVVNRGKRSVALDVRLPAGREIVYRLVEQADAFIHNTRPEAIERGALGYETLNRRNPRLVYVDALAWGSKGPDVNARAMDYAGQGRSAFMALNGDEDGPAAAAGGGALDAFSGLMAAVGTMAGLLVRQRTGRGQRVETSMLSSGMWWMAAGIVTTLAGNTNNRFARLHPDDPVCNYHQCGDGQWIAVDGHSDAGVWQQLCRALGASDLAADERFADKKVRSSHAGELVGKLDAIFRQKTSAEWSAILTANDLPFAPVNGIEDLPRDPQIMANDYLEAVEHPLWGEVVYPANPVKLSRSVTKIKSAAPEFGQHTEEVLIDVLGYSWDDIAALQEEGVI